ncbi:hypothetical protein [Zavarzinella formosa]|uniref:hypothetical protein n=1 Tax=Zavarzinella formosa TaxID=360055 RepID=UPI0002D841B0|nr:hypothetical protein [Zavarzinella formosa]
MTKTELHHTFTAVDDSGEIHEIQVWQNYVINCKPDGTDVVSPTTIELRAASGVPVNKVSKGEYRTFPDGTRLTSDSPEAI